MLTVSLPTKVTAAAGFARETIRYAFGVSAIAVAVLAGAVVATSSPAEAFATNETYAAPLIDAHEWAAYKRAFVRSDGRVVDVENNGVSHSEGQGYGLLIAAHANDRATFDRIWTFTRNKLQIRDDSLLSWRYFPNAQPHVPDTNNATDGDILVAYGLLRGATQWGDKRYLAEADKIIGDIGRHLIGDVAGMKVLKPGKFGFDNIPGNRGPVVNLSYYVYGALRTFALVRPEFDWDEVVHTGRVLTQRAQFGSHKSAPDWIAIDSRTGKVSVAEGMDQKSGYNAVRIPLYMASGNLPGDDVAAFDWSWNVAGEGFPMERDVPSGKALSKMNDHGYRFISSLSRCMARGIAIPTQEIAFRPTAYFGSSLHLIGLAAAREYHPACIDQPTNVLIGSQTAPAQVFAPAAAPAAPRPSFTHTQESSYGNHATPGAHFRMN